MKTVKYFLDKGYLISPEVAKKIKKEEREKIIKKLQKEDLVLTKEKYSFIKKGPPIEVLSEYNKSQENKKIGDFVDFYNRRLSFLKEILEEKISSKDITSINKLSYGVEGNIIGMVREVEENFFKLEDTTGSVKCLSPEKVLEDDVVGIKGKMEKEGFSVEKIYYPEIPLTKKVNTSKEERFVAFTDNPPVSREHSYLFTPTKNKEILEKLKKQVIVMGKTKLKKSNLCSLSHPFLIKLHGIKIFALEITWLDKIKNKLHEEDTEKIIISLLKRRHFLPFDFVDGDPYLLREVPDLIFITGLDKPFFLNYKGVSVVSITHDKGYLVNLKNREAREIK